MNGLKALRESTLLTQEQLAAASGLTTATISRIETGRVKASIKTIKAIAKPLRINPKKLYDLLRNPPNNRTVATGLNP